MFCFFTTLTDQHMCFWLFDYSIRRFDRAHQACLIILLMLINKQQLLTLSRVKHVWINTWCDRNHLLCVLDTIRNTPCTQDMFADFDFQIKQQLLFLLDYSFLIKTGWLCMVPWTILFMFPYLSHDQTRLVCWLVICLLWICSGSWSNIHYVCLILISYFSCCWSRQTTIAKISNTWILQHAMIYIYSWRS